MHFSSIKVENYANIYLEIFSFQNKIKAIKIILLKPIIIP